MKKKELYISIKIVFFRYFLLTGFIFFNSCSLFNKNEIKIETNQNTGKKIYFSEVDKNYKQTKNFSKIWSKLYSKRFRSYHKFLDNKFTIMGQSKISDKDFLIIRDKKNSLYKAKVKLDDNGVFILPNYLFFEEDLKNAKKLIDKNIWLNYIDNINIFFSYSDYKFSRCSMVNVIGLINYQNGESYLPLWLKIKTKEGFEGFLRYSPSHDNVGFEDHYFIENPLPKKWGDKIINLILNGKIELGMNEKQLRISIGNPDIINKTSSRHGLSEQWIYLKDNSKNTFYQFEYGKLVYVSK